MVSALQMQNYYRQSALTVDTAQTQHKFYEDDDCILDEAVLDPNALDSGLEMSPTLADSRRESFAVSTSLFSPKNESWTAVDMESVPSNNPFMETQHVQLQPQHPHTNNPFMRMDQQTHQQAQPFIAQPANPWSMNSSGSCTPMAQFDGLPSDFDQNGTHLYQRPQMQAQTPFTNPANHVPMFPAVNGHPMQQSASKDGWMTGLKDPKHHSPTIRSHNDLRRGDGIRKKNARFDIPAERTLNNIDALIAQSSDETEIKELKQQKRLLRNRQAALDSRQRKKQHTERLEDEKKQYSSVIGDLESEIEQLRGQLEDMYRKEHQNTQIIESLEFEKEEMVRNHTIETGELRKKVTVLTSHVQNLENTALPPQHTTGMLHQQYAGGPQFSGMEGLAVDGSWDTIGLFGADYTMAHSDVKQELQHAPTKKQDDPIHADGDKPSTQGGLLFMMFLVGAFVLSSRQPNIPRFSDDIRAASATLLEDVFKDAGVGQPASGNLDPMAPQPTGTSWGSAPMASMPVLGGGLDGMTPSMLGDLSDALTQPTQDQQNEQLFGLTAAQYDGVQSQEYLLNAPSEKSTSQGRRNLAEALASMQSSSKAEVYTRSLLWDQIPRDVVRNFAKMVAESNHQDGNDAAP